MQLFSLLADEYRVGHSGTDLYRVSPCYIPNMKFIAIVHPVTLQTLRRPGSPSHNSILRVVHLQSEPWK
jgi:hypothetical protein